MIYNLYVNDKIISYKSQILNDFHVFAGHPSYISIFHFYFVSSLQLALDKIFVPSCRINKSVPLASENFSLSLSEQTRSRSSGFISSSSGCRQRYWQRWPTPRIPAPDKTRSSSNESLGEEEQDQTADKKDKTNNTDLRPTNPAPMFWTLSNQRCRKKSPTGSILSTDFWRCQLQILYRISRSNNT